MSAGDIAPPLCTSKVLCSLEMDAVIHRTDCATAKVALQCVGGEGLLGSTSLILWWAFKSFSREFEAISKLCLVPPISLYYISMSGDLACFMLYNELPTLASAL